MYLCETCQKAFEPKVLRGVKKLPTFLGYTVDLRLQQFRNIVYGQTPKFIEFESEKGQRMLAYLHTILAK